MEMEKIIAYAKAEGYDYVEYIGEWLGYEVYNPYFENEDELNPLIVGLPDHILVQGETIRLSTPEECFQILDAFYDDEYEDEDDDEE